jgi:hypothetical protein
MQHLLGGTEMAFHNAQYSIWHLTWAGSNVWERKHCDTRQKECSVTQKRRENEFHREAKRKTKDKKVTDVTTVFGETVNGQRCNS